MRDILSKIKESNNYYLKTFFTQDLLIFPLNVELIPYGRLQGVTPKKQSIDILRDDVGRGTSVGSDMTYFGYSHKPDYKELKRNFEPYLKSKLGEKNIPAVYEFWSQDLNRPFEQNVSAPKVLEEIELIPYIGHFTSLADLYCNQQGEVFVTVQNVSLIIKIRDITGNLIIIQIPGIIETTFKLEPGQGYRLVEASVSNSLLETFCLSDHYLSAKEIQQGWKEAQREEQKNVNELKKIKVTQQSKEVLENVGLRDLGQLFVTLYDADLDTIGKHSLRVKCKEDFTFYTVIGKPIKPEELVCFCIAPKGERDTVDIFRRVTFYVQAEGDFKPGDCVLSHAEDLTIAAGVEMLKKISDKVDISDLPVDVEARKELSPKALAWLTCQAKGVVPCQDQAGTPVELGDLMPEGGDQEKVKSAMQEWIDWAPLQGKKAKVQRAFDELSKRARPTMRSA